jgi:hypothetical protein
MIFPFTTSQINDFPIVDVFLETGQKIPSVGEKLSVPEFIVMTYS